MPVFNYTFIVNAPLTAVLDFHHDTRVLQRLSPPPMLVQWHRVDPLANGSLSEFTLWLGPLPMRWTALHSDVGPHGFTDTQTRGPFKVWRHTHRFEAVNAQTTRVAEHIEYEHDVGLRGLFSRLLFAPPALRLLFWYRSVVTRRALEGKPQRAGA
jgi:ligand-binding SRPBCC domain-containing protein